MESIDEPLKLCTNILPGHGPRRTMKEIFSRLAQEVPDGAYPDRYGEGEYLNDFEQEVAALFGKENGIFMPSGTMAQSIALRIWCQSSSNYTVAMSPTAHLEFAEHLGYQFLHGIHRIQFGAPEFLSNRTLRADDFKGLGQKPGAALLELPYRPLGGELPSWDELLAIREWSLQSQVPLHLDGARIWTCRPYYGKSFQEIGSLFDSVYVSFYKDLGGIAGAMLLGPENLIREARVWQKRQGGLISSLFPLVVAARMGFDRVLSQVDSWVDKAREVAGIFSSFPGISVHPDPPHTNIFRLYVQGDPTVLTERHLELASESGTFAFYSLGLSGVPGVATTEIHCWENALAFDPEQLAPFLEKLLE